MLTHSRIDKRNLEFARRIVHHIENDPARSGIIKAQGVCGRWLLRGGNSAAKEWHGLLQKSWADIRAILLDESENSNRLRQSSPFCGILTNQERWEIIRKHAQ